MSDFTVVYKKGQKGMVDYISLPDSEDSIKRVAEVFKMLNPRQTILVIFKGCHSRYYSKGDFHDGHNG